MVRDPRRVVGASVYAKALHVAPHDGRRILGVDADKMWLKGVDPLHSLETKSSKLSVTRNNDCYLLVMDLSAKVLSFISKMWR